MAEIKEFNVEQTIAESNKLIRNMFDNPFTKRQMDLIYAIISLIKPDDNKFKVYHISYKAIGQIFNPANPDCTVTVKDIEKAINGIMDKSFKVKNGKRKDYYHYVERASLLEDKSVEFRISDEVKEFYLQLKKGDYTSYLLRDILALSTDFQMNLFRWLACHAGFDKVNQLPIDEAKLHFYGKDISNGELTRKIDSALKAINERTNINASYEKIKEGRSGKIIALQFHIDNKYIKKARKQLTPAQIEANKEKSKEMWQENLEMKRRLALFEEKFGKDAV